MLRNKDSQQPELQKNIPASSQEKSLTILEKIYKKDERQPVNAKEKFFKNAALIDKFVNYLDAESITSLQQTNLALFSSTKTVAMKNILWVGNEKDHQAKKTLSKLDSRHVIVTGKKLMSGLIKDLPLPRESSFELLSGDLKKVLEYKVTDDSDDENDERIDIRQVFSVILSGNAHTFKEFLKIHPIETDKLEQKIAFFYIQLAVFSGEIPMVEAVQPWLGDITRLKNNKPESVNSDDESEEKDDQSNDKYSNMNYLILPAIASCNKFMLDYVADNFVDENVKKVSPDFANRCLQEAFTTDHDEIQNKLIRNIKFLPLFDLAAKVTKENINSKMHDRILNSLKKMCVKSSLDEMKSNHHYFLKQPITLNTERKFELYRSCLHREDKFRQEMIKTYQLTDYKADSATFYDLIQKEIKSINHIKHVIKDFKLDAKSWLSYKNRPYCTNLSIIDISAKEGAQETFEYALKELHVPIDLSAIYEPTETNYGLLCYAADSADPKFFQLVMRTLQERKDFDAGKVNWDFIVSHGISACHKKTQNTVILHCLKEYIEYFKKEYNANLSIEKLFLNNVNSIQGKLSVIKFYCENLGLASRLHEIKHNPSLKDLDCMQYALSGIRFDTIQYLVEIAKYDIKEYAGRIMQVVMESWRATEYIQENKNILGYLINKGMPVSQEQFEKFKAKCKSELMNNSYSPMKAEEFDEKYRPIFNDLAKALDTHKPLVSMKR